jgi:hypothetical protein
VLHSVKTEMRSLYVNVLSGKVDIKYYVFLKYYTPKINMELYLFYVSLIFFGNFNVLGIFSGSCTAEL